MTADLADLNARIQQAVAHGQLIACSAKNIRTLLEGAGSDVYFRSVKGLVEAVEKLVAEKQSAAAASA